MTRSMLRKQLTVHIPIPTPNSIKQSSTSLVFRRCVSSDSSKRRHITSSGRTTTPRPSSRISLPTPPRLSPYYFETGYSIFAKRTTRPFPPPFLSIPSGSFSDPLTTHDRFRAPKDPSGQILRGVTNGDDAVLIEGGNFLVACDGVGAWAQKERGHAALWSRLIAHYWASEVERAFSAIDDEGMERVDLERMAPIEWLGRAYAKAKEATLFGKENEIMGTTTASSALLHHKSESQPVVLCSTLGDCATLIFRPGENVEDGEILYRSEEQWHWFDCPRQLGTNSPDTPEVNGVCDTVDVQEGDVVLVASDGVTDNLWEEEILGKVQEWQQEAEKVDGVIGLARKLMDSAREIALDPEAGSPYMERAIDEGLAAEGGKLDDISVVIGIVRRHKD